jgi:hypothetical protein
MKQTIYIFLLLTSISIACREVYDPDITATQKTLVVEGIITDQPGSYTVRLNGALPYDTTNIYTIINPVKKAKVYVTDDKGHMYDFAESDPGYYVSNASDFKGITGIPYTLHVRTSDGNIYESSVQTMLSNDFTDSVYARYVVKDIYFSSYVGAPKVSTNGLELFIDIKNNTSEQYRFRLKSTIYSEWKFSFQDLWTFEPPIVNYSGWYANYPDDKINITGAEYNTSNNNIFKHLICFVPIDKEAYSVNIPLNDTIVKYQVQSPTLNPRKDPSTPPYIVTHRDTTITTGPFNRLVKIELHRISEEMYQYYKNVNSLLSADDKIFDPVTMQLKGNLSCTNSPSRLTLGFFGASSLRYKTYSIHTESNNTTLIPKPNIWPVKEKGYKTDTVWLNK